MTPREILEAASYGGAHFLGMEREIGSIEVGKIADLVIFNGNPLSGIRQSADIRHVVKSGRLYDADTLDEIWPAATPYGVRPWTNADIERTGDRPDTVWDRH
jgi:adenine deaminase